MGLVRRPSFVLILNDRLPEYVLDYASLLPASLSFSSPVSVSSSFWPMDVYSHDVSMIWLKLGPILYTWIPIHLTVFLHKFYWQFLLVYVIVLIVILRTRRLINWNWTFKIVQLIALAYDNFILALGFSSLEYSMAIQLNCICCFSTCLICNSFPLGVLGRILYFAFSSTQCFNYVLQ